MKQLSVLFNLCLTNYIIQEYLLQFCIRNKELAEQFVHLKAITIAVATCFQEINYNSNKRDLSPANINHPKACLSSFFFLVYTNSTINPFFTLQSSVQSTLASVTSESRPAKLTAVTEPSSHTRCPAALRASNSFLWLLTPAPDTHLKDKRGEDMRKRSCFGSGCPIVSTRLWMGIWEAAVRMGFFIQDSIETTLLGLDLLKPCFGNTKLYITYT